MQAVILCAGKSTRTYPLTLTQPKPLLPLIDRSILEWNLEELQGIVDEVILIVGYKAEMIQKRLGNRYGNLRLSYCVQHEQLGTGHAVLQTRPYIRGPFLSLNGDDVYSKEDLEKLASYEAAALVHEVDDPRLYGVYEVDKTGRVLDLEEKPDKPKTNLANLGCYKFPLRIFDFLERTGLSPRGEIEITSAIRDMAREMPVYVVKRQGRWLPTGFAWDLLRNTRALWEEGAAEPHLIDPSARIDPTVKLIPPVYVGPGVTIGPGCIIGPFCSIGRDVTIDAGATIVSSIVMESSTVGAGAFVAHSILGRGVGLGSQVRTYDERPGQRTVVSNVKGKIVDTKMRALGTIIADGVQVGSGVELMPGVKVWPNLEIDAGTKISADLRPEGFVWD